MLLLIFLLAIPALKSSCGDLREECSGGGSTGFGDFDSLHVDVVPYAVNIESCDNLFYVQFSATTGSGNTNWTSVGNLPINFHNLDSITIDSIRWQGLFWGDSIAIYKFYYKCYELTDTTNTERAYINSNDSLFVPDGSPAPQWGSKVISSQDGTSVDTWHYPFFTYGCAIYWHNRGAAAHNVRLYTFEVFLRAFYTK